MKVVVSPAEKGCVCVYVRACVCGWMCKCTCKIKNVNNFVSWTGTKPELWTLD